VVTTVQAGYQVLPEMAVLEAAIDVRCGQQCKSFG
jgi:hypothetical protein